MSVLYTAKIVSIEKITEPVNELFSENLGLQYIIEDYHIGKFKEGEIVNYLSCSQKIVDWASKFTEQELELELEKLRFNYQPRLIEKLISNTPNTLIIDHNSTDGLDSVFSWFIHSALHKHNPAKFAAVDALRVKIDLVSIHPDAWFAAHDDEWGVRSMALRILTEIENDSIEKSAIYKLFGNDWYEQWFGSKSDGAYLIIPQSKLTSYIPLEFTNEFKTMHKDTWWMNDFYVKNIFKHNQPSDNAPYAFTQFDIVTFPFWLPNPKKTESFESRAYPG